MWQLDCQVILREKINGLRAFSKLNAHEKIGVFFYACKYLYFLDII